MSPTHGTIQSRMPPTRSPRKPNKHPNPNRPQLRGGTALQRSVRHLPALSMVTQFSPSPPLGSLFAQVLELVRRGLLSTRSIAAASVNTPTTPPSQLEPSV